MERIASKLSVEIRGILTLIVRYLSVVLSSVPGGLLCYVLIKFGVIQEIAVSISIVLGIISAVFWWKFIEKDNRSSTLDKIGYVENSIASGYLSEMGIARRSRNYFTSWSLRKNITLFLRFRLTLILTFALAALTLVKEILRYLDSRNIDVQWLEGFSVIISPLLAVTAIFAALWESKGNKLDISDQEKRFAIGIENSLLELNSLTWRFLAFNKSAEKTLETFINQLLKISSATLCESNIIHAGVMLYNPETNALTLSNQTEGWPSNNISIQLNRNKERKGVVQMAFETGMIAHVPTNSSGIGWLYKENGGQYAVDEFITGRAEVLQDVLGLLESVLCIPITSYAGEGKKAFYGVCVFLAKRDCFIPRDFVMATCFANILAQAIDVYRLPMPNSD